MSIKQSDINAFIVWEMRSRDSIDVKRCYIDVAGELVTGVLLSQIIYWHLPDSEGKSKLKVQQDECYWIAKKREDWWDEVRISPKQFDRCVASLEEKGLIVTKLYRFQGSPTKHIRLKWDALLQALNELPDMVLPKRSKSNLPSENDTSHIGENGYSPKVNIDIPQRSISNLPKGKNVYIDPERTTKITTKTTHKEEDSPTPHTTIVVGQIPDESVLKQIEIPSSRLDNLEPNLGMAGIDSTLEQISRLEAIDSFLELVIPASENSNQSQAIFPPMPLSEQEREALKQAQVYAFNPAIAPWRDAATIVNSKVQKAIFDANPEWYSTGNGSVNIKKINDRVKSLERTMRGTGAQAIEAYVELMNYVTMSQVPNSAEIIKQVSSNAKQQATTNNLMSMLTDRYSQKGVQP